jgi:MFS family permease
MNLVNPVLPIYITSFNISYTLVGLVMSSFGISRLFVEIPGGLLTDRIGRKPIVLLGYALSITSHLLAGLAQSPLELTASRVLMGIGSALFLTANRVFVTEIGTKSQRLRYLSLFQTTISFAGILAPTLGGLISDNLGVRTLFFLSAIVSIIGFLLVWAIKVRGVVSKSKEDTSWRRLNILKILKDIRILILSVSCCMIFFIFSSIRSNMIPLYGVEELNLTSLEIGLIISLFSAVIMVGLLLIPHRLEDRIGRPSMLPLSLIICSVSIILISFATDIITLSAFIIPLGVGLSILQPTVFSMISDYSESEYRGLTMGFARTVAAFGIIAGSALVGYLIDLGQPLLVFYIVAGIIGLFSILTFTIFKKAS